MRHLIKAPIWTSKASIYLSTAILAVMCIHITAEIISRALFNYPFVGTIEMVSFHYMVSVSFLPLGYVQMAKANITVDVLSSLLPKKALFFVDLFANAVTLVAIGGVLLASFDMAMQQTNHLEAARAAPYNIWIWPSRWFLVIGFGSCLFVLLGQMVKSFLRDDLTEKLGLDEYELPETRLEEA